MKKLFAATVMAGALMSCAGAATAETYQGVASHNGTYWTVTWSNVTPACAGSSLFSAGSLAVANIDGFDTALSIMSVAARIDGNDANFFPSPAGVMSKLTFNGQDSFQCDGHTFLLPGYGAPAPVPIPTLSEWAMILLGVALAGGAALTLLRRRQAA